MEISKCRFFLALISITLTASLYMGCAMTHEEAAMMHQRHRSLANQKINDPSQSLWITVNSTPSGAKIYGVNDGQPASYIGTTPMTLKYAHVYFSTYGTFPQETLVYKSVGALELTRRGKASLAFQCILLKDGYRSYHMYHQLEYREGSTFSNPELRSDKGGVHKTYTALLDPIFSPAPSPPTPPVQQQQQQQQQTVVIPDTGSKKGHEKGTVMVSSTPDNADVSVDGMFVGNSPCNLPLTEGIHIIEVKLSGYKLFKRELRILSGGEVTIRATLERE